MPRSLLWNMLCCLWLAVPFAVAAPVVHAQADGWAFYGPDIVRPCDCHTIVAGRGESGLLYAAGDGAGVFRSEDGGASWVAANAGLPSLRITSLAAAPSQLEVVYATIGDTPYRSDDAGRNWRQVAESVVPPRGSFWLSTDTKRLLVKQQWRR